MNEGLLGIVTTLKRMLILIGMEGNVNAKQGFS